MPTLYHNNRFATNSSEKADLLNDFFVSQSILNDENVNIPFIIPNAISMPMFEIEPHEVKSVLKSLPLGKASGPDEINNRILLELAEELCIPLCKLFNKSLNASQIPSKWKEAHVCAIYKKGDRSVSGQ